MQLQPPRNCVKYYSKSSSLLRNLFLSHSMEASPRSFEAIKRDAGSTEFSARFAEVDSPKRRNKSKIKDKSFLLKWGNNVKMFMGEGGINLKKFSE